MSNIDNNNSLNIEIERKFIISMPDISIICGIEGYTCTHILQIYLCSEDGTTRRIRKRSGKSHTVYTTTTKRRIDRMSSEELEREISEEEFLQLKLCADTSAKPIIKDRYTFAFGERIFEIDIYPSWKHTCIMEVELPSTDASVDFPPFINIIKEVTGDRAYSNAKMARAFPPETKI